MKLFWVVLLISGLSCFAWLHFASRGHICIHKHTLFLASSTISQPSLVDIKVLRREYQFGRLRQHGCPINNDSSFISQYWGSKAKINDNSGVVYSICALASHPLKAAVHKMWPRAEWGLLTFFGILECIELFTWNWQKQKVIWLLSTFKTLELLFWNGPWLCLL